MFLFWSRLTLAAQIPFCRGSSFTYVWATIIVTQYGPLILAHLELPPHSYPAKTFFFVLRHPQTPLTHTHRKQPKNKCQSIPMHNAGCTCHLAFPSSCPLHRGSVRWRRVEGHPVEFNEHANVAVSLQNAVFKTRKQSCGCRTRHERCKAFRSCL